MWRESRRYCYPPIGTVLSGEIRSNGDAGETAKSPIAMLSDVVRTNSPTTSTPGSTPSPKGRKEDMFKESELQEGEVSVINSSERKENIDEEEDDEIEVIGETEGEESTLDGKSVRERYQAASDSTWNMILEKEEKEEEPKSCVAHRTRSHMGEIRRKETSIFLGEEDSAMGSFLDASGDPVDSLTLIKANQEDINWDNKDEWKTGIKELNTTVDQATEIIKRGNSNINVVREIRRRRDGMNSDEEQEIVDLEREDEEAVSDKKKVTFYIEHKKCTSAIEKVIRALEYLVGMASNTTPRRSLDSVIKILVSICIDLNSQMQTAQHTIGAMSEMIEDMLKGGEEVKELSAENRRLKKVIEDLRKQMDHWERLNRNLMEFTRPEGLQRDAVKELVELKVIKEGLEKQISKMRHALKDRSEQYEVAFAWKEMRKKEVESLKKQVDVLKELRDKESIKHENELTEEKKKLKTERTMKKKLKEENSIIRDLNEDNMMKLEILNGEMTQMKDDYEAQVEGMKRDIDAREERMDGMEVQIIELQAELAKQGNSQLDSTRRREREMKVLEERVRERQKNLIETKKELIDANNNLKSSLKAIETSNKRAEEAERKCEELRKKIEAQTQGQPPVANIEEPGPSKVEEVEPEDPIEESSQLQTTGGIFGDTEGDETFTKSANPPPPPFPRGKIKEHGRRRGKRMKAPH